MTNSLTYTCSGADPIEARRILGEVVAEMDRRTQIAVSAGQTEWTGPDLHLTVDNLPHLAADAECRDLLTFVLKFGRRLGVAGVARGGDGTLRDTGGSHVLRDLLAASVVLRYEAALVSV